MTVWERYSLISIFFQVLSVLNPFTKINLFISNSFFHCQHEGIRFLTLFFASLFLKYFCFHCESVFDSLIIFLLTAFSFPVHLITSPSSSHLVKKKKKASWVFCLHFPSYLTVSTILGKKPSLLAHFIDTLNSLLPLFCPIWLSHSWFQAMFPS